MGFLYKDEEDYISVSPEQHKANLESFEKVDKIPVYPGLEFEKKMSKEIFKYVLADAVVGQMSLVGVGHERPCSWGNYFWLGGKYPARVLNMWAENLSSASLRFLPDGKVRVRLYQEFRNESPDHIRGASWCLIDDPRIPPDWYYNKLCFTGGACPPVYMVTDMYAYLGDPTNELEQFTDPKSYYEKRGGELLDSGIVKYTFKGDSKPRGARYNWLSE